ncbi:MULTISPECIES: hypothetical protein [Bradyrhizobium]|uniref:Uncharacterized protein n=2 Tax=Bradyrhizobium TaxID=374 RepID=A0ABY0Q6Z8_9BRAD|nr:MULTISPECIES: hypothetical protein [Bradyrhizobium]SDJ62966.1 hypothetical protein SAMN05444163_5975 [Bradyrhizobium ottawaense]SEC34114.1 hypothetical protein SAMN05444171_1184 [Bradyrhizobium lablabi]
MTKAIEHIVAGYSTLKNRKALEEIREHRKRLLMENRMSAASSGFNLDRITADLEDEISIVEAALSRFQDQTPGQPIDWP